jgi:hypothetical protein
MSTREFIYFYAGGGALLLFCLAISYWSVNFFIKQFTERTCELFRERIMAEAERALKVFREGMCEQIVQQEKKSDALGKLYATQIDMMRTGKEFVSGVVNGDLQQAERMLRSLRNTGETFAEIYQKESLYFPDSFSKIIKDHIDQQKSVVQVIEIVWNLIQGEGAQSGNCATEIRQTWLQFEDKINQVMDLMRNEFRSGHGAGNVMMKWLNDPPKDAVSPPP